MLRLAEDRVTLTAGDTWVRVLKAEVDPDDMEGLQDSIGFIHKVAEMSNMSFIMETKENDTNFFSLSLTFAP